MPKLLPEALSLQWDVPLSQPLWAYIIRQITVAGSGSTASSGANMIHSSVSIKSVTPPLISDPQPMPPTASSSACQTHLSIRLICSGCGFAWCVSVWSRGVVSHVFSLFLSDYVCKHGQYVYICACLLSLSLSPSLHAACHTAQQYSAWVCKVEKWQTHRGNKRQRDGEKRGSCLCIGCRT